MQLFVFILYNYVNFGEKSITFRHNRRTGGTSDARKKLIDTLTEGEFREDVFSEKLCFKKKTNCYGNSKRKILRLGLHKTLL